MNQNKQFDNLYGSLSESDQILLLSYIADTYFNVAMEGFNTGPNAKILLKEGLNAGPNAKILSQREVCPTCGKPK